MSFYNKFASIAIGGPNVNTVPTPYGIASLDVCGNAVFRNNVEVVGTLTYAGATIAYANSDTSGNLTLDGSANLNILSTSGQATLNSLRVLNDSSLNSLDVSNNTTLNTLTTLGQATLNSLRVLNDSSLNNLDVSNNTTLNTLTTSGQATLNSLRVLNDTSLNSLDVSNNTRLNTLTTTGQANLSGLTISGNLIANSDASFNAGLRVASDVSFNSGLYVIGNARAQNLKVGTDNNATQLRLGLQTNIPTFSFYTTGTTSNIGNGNAFKPVKVIVPPVFPDSSVNMIVPIDIYGSRTGGMTSGTWTLTYTSVTMNIYKNNVLQSSVGNSISPVGFSGGTSKTATNSITLSAGGYVGFYFGYFNCSFPVQAYSTNENIYDIELTISCSATHSSGAGIMVSVASVGGFMGYSAYNTPFTQDRVRSATQITYVSSVPTYTTPAVSSTYINAYGSDVNISCDGELMIVSNTNINMLCNQSYRLDAPNGYWTGSSAGNFYLRSHSSDSQIIFGNQASDWSSINSNSTQLTINTYNKNYSLEAGTGTANTQANIITENANDYIQLQTNNNIELISNTGDINLTVTDTANQIYLNSSNVNIPAAAAFNLIPAGTILTTVTSTVPTGYFYCNAQQVNRTTYARLFAAIGTTFGAGNGTTTFNVPDFRGAFLRGASSQTVGGVTYTAAAVGTAQQDQVLQTTTYATNEGFRDCAAGTRECVARARITGDPVDTNTGILAQFQRQGTENRPFNYAVYYYIKY